MATLQYLRTIQPQSPHIVFLIETVNTRDREWLILPKLHPISELSMHASGALLHSQLVQFCRDLIEGLAYLHRHGVAHLDVKPGNLVYDNRGHLQIIDFDSAVRVSSEDEKITGLYGTRGWRAPEIGDDEEEIASPLFSPIRADRWSCGKVLLEFVEEVEAEEGKILGRFATSLMDKDPHCRPSLLDWDELGGMASSRELCR